MKRKLAVDIDNTLWDLIRPWIRIYNVLYKDNVDYEDITEYEFFHMLKVNNKSDMLDLLTSKQFWTSVFPYENSYEYLRKLNDEFELYIVTSTSYKTPKEKFDRLFNMFDFLKEDQLVITSHKDLLNVDIMVDDCVDHLTEGNYMKFLIDAPYNRDVEDNTIIRVDDLKGVYDYLHELN